MSDFQTGFKNDIFTTIFQLTGKTWVKITIAYALLTIISQLFSKLIGADAINKKFETIFSDPQIFSNPEALKEVFSSSTMLDIVPENFMMLMIPFIMISLLISAWVYNFSFITSNDVIKGEAYDFSTTAKRSINSGVFKIIGVLILIYLIFIVSILISAAAGAISGFLTFLLFLAVLVMIFKFTLILPAFIIGNQSLGEAFSYSFRHITFIRALKLFGISILALLVFIFMGVIVGAVSLLFLMIPLVGPIIQVVISAIIGGFMTAVTASALVGLYYRYAEQLTVNEDDQFIIDELQN